MIKIKKISQMIEEKQIQVQQKRKNQVSNSRDEYKLLNQNLSLMHQLHKFYFYFLNIEQKINIQLVFNKKNMKQQEEMKQQKLRKIEEKQIQVQQIQKKNQIKSKIKLIYKQKELYCLNQIQFYKQKYHNPKRIN
ncbi:hypothetical protein TTHERM_001424462 (macronuclear) [Tetrahymena thermophila SB210]|uniref:Uncharacterized protein n=1 Tax=Tetrahymena thermophila (strain SB210) TaxID=312017 RepID=W7X9S3_TETTS|nr:hypothetical protein TTHERM_001424462 [Tetrahymena thermophila SB210]EWS74087.1 hypothetical protein TTHERM_001424462 [Tetrahymena thermophila SB210]|eukprot:XP_012653380.1 hypothetical protein TTHERM_001424462 [Tetrahymena thermophila SB210]